MKSTIITLADIAKKAEGIALEIPDWEPGKTITVRVRATDMTPHIMNIDKMPNVLKTSAHEVFNGSSMTDEKKVELIDGLDMESMRVMLPVMDAIAKAVLVEPTFDAIEEVYPLTMGQKMALFQFAMGGLDKLDSFR